MAEPPPTHETRRSLVKKRREFQESFEYLAERGDERGFRLYLRSLEVAEGSEEYALAFVLWRERTSEKQLPPRRPGASVPARSRRTSPGASP
jgi:hypothetical protein